MALKDALKTLDAAFEDLASLEVQTYTGTIEVQADGKLGDFEAYIKEAGKTDGKIKLVAVTKMHCDGDAVNLVPDTEFPPHVQQAHASAVKAGIETRQGILNLFAGFFKLTAK